jgi:hypothetical protein
MGRLPRRTSNDPNPRRRGPTLTSRLPRIETNELLRKEKPRKRKGQWPVSTIQNCRLGVGEWLKVELDWAKYRMEGCWEQLRKRSSQRATPCQLNNLTVHIMKYLANQKSCRTADWMGRSSSGLHGGRTLPHAVGNCGH